MAFNLATFKTRTLTAAVFALLMLAGLLWSQWSFLLLFSIIHFGCWTEFQKLIGKMDPDYAGITPYHRYGIMLAGWCLLLYMTTDQFRLFGIGLHAMGWWMGLVFAFFLPVLELLFNPNIRPKNIGYSALGLLYISLPLGAMMNLRGLQADWTAGSGKTYDMGLILPLAIVFSIWINDTMAYLVGSLIGRTPLSSISPRKTWEGTIGGIVLSVGIMGAWSYKLGINYSEIAILAAIASIAGTAGDLLESKIKRMAKVKDSGSILPGHGGFLDRFDSLLIATPFVWLFVMGWMS